MKRKIISIAIILVMMSSLILAGLNSYAVSFDSQCDAKSMILIEAETGTVLYEKDADLTLPPASVTKVMTMLIVMEKIDNNELSFEDIVVVSEFASSMGGSQVYLEPGEEMKVYDLLKSVVIASANDACVALAEHIAGSEEAFVSLMNEKAKELRMVNTNFENTNGLDDTTVNHMTSARDIAIMSAELIVKHPKILEFSSIWMDSIRNGEFGLTNTNRLIRFYNGANGLKTGSTSKAKFCISASAKRNGMQLICVIMGAPTRDERNEIAKKLLDFGFANYSFQKIEADKIPNIRVIGGVKNNVEVTYDTYSFVTEKSNAGKIEKEIQIKDCLNAPIGKNEKIGEVIYKINGEIIKTLPIITLENVERVTFSDLIYRLLYKLLY